jgi:Tfp pilus assembly PilM family ATPase/cell division protein FtsB
LKERLSSTENLLRAIRGGANEKPSDTGTSPDAESLLPGLGETPTAPIAPANPATRAGGLKNILRTPVSELFKLNLGKPLQFSAGGKSKVCGISLSARHLTVSLLRRSDASVQASGRYNFGPDQRPGEAGSAAFLSDCLERVVGPSNGAEYWAVLRSSDVDLNVLSVPKLSGDKLDAAVFWSLQKDKKFTESEYVLDYLVMGPTNDAPEPRLDVLTCLARKADVDALAELFRAAGTVLTGITVVPAALLNLYRRPNLPGSFHLAANVHVETDYSAIGLYTAGRLVFSRFIRSGAGGMTDDLVEHFRLLSRPTITDIHDIDLELPLPGTEPLPEGLAGLLGEGQGDALPDAPAPAQPITPVAAVAVLQHALLGGPEPQGLAEEHHLSSSQVMQIIAPAIERMGRQVERTLEYFASTTQMRCDGLHFSGEIFGSPEVVQALGGQLGYPAAAFDATAILGTPEGKVPATRRMSLAPSIAAALCQPDRGINLLSNYKRRTAQEMKQRVNRFILLGVAAVMLVIAAIGLWFELDARAKRTELAQANTELLALGPTIEDEQLASALQSFKTRKGALTRASSRMAGPAMLAELARRTPPQVKIMTLSVDTQAKPAASAPGPGAPAPAPTPAPAPAAGAPASGAANALVVLEGIVTGEQNSFESLLSRYMLDLQSSPLCVSLTVNHSSVRELPGEGQVLFFVLHLGVR